MTREEALVYYKKHELRIKGIMAEVDESLRYRFLQSLEATEMAIEALEQEPKTGHWIIETWNNKEHYICSSCQHVVAYEPYYQYCPYCGAKMVEQRESEE